MGTPLRERLKNQNRTLLEMHLGIWALGIVAQFAGAFIVKDQLVYALSLWLGIGLALAGTVHMYRCLDRALDYGEKEASRILSNSYLVRYAVLAVILITVSVTRVLNPLVVFFACMTVKVTAFMQPFTHKLCNKLFHETDPDPEPLEEAAPEGPAR